MTHFPSSDASTPTPNNDVPPENIDAVAVEVPAPGCEAARLADTIGVQFKDLNALRLALTHRSILHERTAGSRGRIMQSNERLEFLGDAYLGAIVAEHLYDRYPDADEGQLTTLRVGLVRTETLVRWARSIDLGCFLQLGQGERITESPRDRILAGAFEALVGAIAIDRGWREARRFVLRFLRLEAEIAPPSGKRPEANPKGRLQEYAQGTLGSSPAYEVLAIEGPDHDRRFTVAVNIEGERWGSGLGASKREAQQAAAREALQRIDDMATTSKRPRSKRSRRPVTPAVIKGDANE